MTDRMHDEQFDREIRQFLEWHSTDVSGAPTATDVAERIGSRSGTTRVPPRLAPQLLWALLALLLAAALVGAAVVGATLLRGDPRVVNVVEAIPTISRVINPPSPNAVPSPSAVPSRSAVPSPSAGAPEASRLTGRRFVADEFSRPFRYTVPDGVDLLPTTASEVVYALTEGSDSTYPGSWFERVENSRGITVALASDARTHNDLGLAHILVRPDSFFDDLRRNQSLEVGPTEDTNVSGLAAEEANVQFRDSVTGNNVSYPDLHLEGPQDASPLLDIGFPGMLTVIRADEGVLLIHVWAADADELDAWLPVARAIVGSIRFLDTP